MAGDFPCFYPYSHYESLRQNKEKMWQDSENVCCARAIEKVIREQYESDNPALLPEGCAASVLEEYGIRRTSFVLAHSLKELDETPSLRELISEEAREWANRQSVLNDKTYGRYYTVDTAIVLLNQFVSQTREAYQALGLFGREHCSAGMYDGNVEGKVLVLSPDTLAESYWSQENQLWLATGGFGCEPKAKGRAIYATCLGDGEATVWNREDFVGVLDEQHLPGWAKEKLEALHAPEQTAAPVMGGMTMG